MGYIVSVGKFSFWGRGSSVIWFPVFLAFLLIIALVWITEYFEMTNHLFGLHSTTFNWSEAGIQTIVIAIVGVLTLTTLMRTIKERIKIEEAFEKSERRLADIIDFLPDAAFAINLDGHVILWNKGMEEITGIKAEDMLGRGDYEYALSFYRERRPLLVDLALKPDERIECIYDYLRRDSGVLTAEIEITNATMNKCIILSSKASPIFDHRGKITGAIQTIRDITRNKCLEEKLKRASQEWRTSFDAIRDVVVILDSENKVVKCNKAMSELTGKTYPQLIGENFSEVLRDASIDSDYYSLFIRTDEDGGRNSCEVKMRGRWFKVTIHPGEDMERGVIEVVQVMTDITDQKGAEEETKRSERRYRAIAEDMPALICRFLGDGTLTFVNDAYCEYFGRTKEELIGMDFFNLIPEEERAMVRSQYGALSEKKNAITYEHEAFDRHGNRCWQQWTDRAIFNDAGQLVEYQSVGLDITGRRRAEEQVREYSKNLQKMVDDRTRELQKALGDVETAREGINQVVESIGDALVVTDNENRIILMNRTAENLFGAHFSGIMCFTLNDLIKNSAFRESMLPFLEKYEPGLKFDFEVPAIAPKHPRIMRARTSPYEDRRGMGMGIITIIHDVTYEREIDQMKTDFISTAAHELRSPLTAIQGFSEILTTRDDIGVEERHKFLNYINKQAIRLSAIIGDLLDIARIEAGRGLVLEKTFLEMGKIISYVVSFFEVDARKHTFEVSLPKDTIAVVADRDKIIQVFQNILSNAVKYSPAGGVIKISGKVSDTSYQVTVEDEGIGMTPEQMQHIFEKFYRADPYGSPAEGTGLGMGIVKHVVDAHNGNIKIESEYGRGTRVAISLPCV